MSDSGRKKLNKTALITGASQGLGAAIAMRLASDGFNIAINCYSEKDMENALSVAEECEKYGIKTKCFIADISDFNAAEQLVKDVKAYFESVDVLVNNAGITRDGLIARMSESQFDVVAAVNYKGVFNMIRHISPIMIKQREGRIINISSVAGVFGNAGQFNYSAAKAGVIGMTLAASKELGGRNITVNAVAPGFIKTHMTDVLDDKVKEKALENISLRRFGEPKEVAGTVSFLAGEDSAYITGQIIVIDGGLLM